MSALPGEPAALLAQAEGYLSSAAIIESATDDLRALTAEGSSLAVGEVRERATTTALLLDEAHERYRGTAVALHEYAVALQHAHERADAAASDRAWSESQLSDADFEVSRLRYRLDQLRLDPTTPTGSIEYIESQYEGAQWQARRLQHAVEAAAGEHQAAVDEMNVAAERAITAINAAIIGTNNDIWDRIGTRLDHVGAYLADVWGAFVDLLANVVTAVLTSVALVLVVLALAVAIVVVIVVLVAIMAVVLTAIVAILTSPWFWLLLSGAMLFGSIALLSLLIRAKADTQEPPMEVRPYSDDGANDTERNAYADSQRQASYDSSDDFIETAGYVDRLGGDREHEPDHKTVVDIKNMGGDPPHWVVTLPSTQDWQLAGFLFGDDNGFTEAAAANDLDANLAFLLFPEWHTRYERAVLESMSRAGIGPDDPVMLVGFSQGGILAGHLAANRPDEFNFTRVLAVGAPIDGMPIPEASHSGAPVRVVSIQHVGDPVPGLDLREPPSIGDHWTTYRETARDPQTTSGVVGSGAHDSGLYEATLERLLVSDPSINDVFRDFLGPVEAHRQYEFAE